VVPLARFLWLGFDGAIRWLCEGRFEARENAGVSALGVLAKRAYLAGHNGSAAAWKLDWFVRAAPTRYFCDPRHDCCEP